MDKLNSTLGFTASALLAVFASSVITAEYIEQATPAPKVTLTLSAQPALVSYTQSDTPAKVTPAPRASKDTLFKLLYSVESRNGKVRYRPSNKTGACGIDRTEACGHHQITAIALKQIGCTTKQCFLDRDDKVKSERMARKYLAWQAKAFDNHTILFQYLAYNQGGYGISQVYAVADGKRKHLGKRLRHRMNKNIAHPARYNKLSSRAYAQAFLGYWAIKVEKELAKLKLQSQEHRT